MNTSISGGYNRSTSTSVYWRAGDLWLNTSAQRPGCTELDIEGAGGAP